MLRLNKLYTGSEKAASQSVQNPSGFAGLPLPRNFSGEDNFSWQGRTTSLGETADLGERFPFFSHLSQLVALLGTTFEKTLLVAHSATQYIKVCLFICSFVTLFQIQAVILYLLAYFNPIQFNSIV